MRFTDDEIAIARQFHKAGLAWEPKAGHYVYDETGFCKQTSPFQEKVYFILNYEYFMRTVGGVEQFKEIMFWLPTWYDLRELLTQHGVSSEELASAVQSHNAIEKGTERLVLYQLLAQQLSIAV